MWVGVFLAVSFVYFLAGTHAYTYLRDLPIMPFRNSARVKVLGLALYGPLAASTRHRLSQYVPGLAALGIDVDVMPLLNDDYIRRRFSSGQIGFQYVARGLISRAAHLSRQHHYDCAWVQGEVIPMAPAILETAFMRLPYAYDFDDAYYQKYRSGRIGALEPLLGRKFERVIGKAAAVFPGNENLRAYASQFNDRITVVPTVVDHIRYSLRQPHRDDRALNVGWIGSPSSIRFLKVLAGPLATLAQEAPVRLSVVGGVAPDIKGVEVLNIPWSEDTEVAAISEFDVGVMPLVDEPWTRGKCAFKLIQYMACGVPVIGSPVGANCDVVTPECGYLAETVEDWLTALRAIRDDPRRAEAMGLSGRERVARLYSLESQLPVIAAGLLAIAKGHD